MGHVDFGELPRMADGQVWRGNNGDKVEGKIEK